MSCSVFSDVRYLAGKALRTEAIDKLFSSSDGLCAVDPGAGLSRRARNDESIERFFTLFRESNRIGRAI